MNIDSFKFEPTDWIEFSSDPPIYKSKNEKSRLVYYAGDIPMKTYYYKKEVMVTLFSKPLFTGKFGHYIKTEPIDGMIGYKDHKIAEI